MSSILEALKKSEAQRSAGSNSAGRAPSQPHPSGPAGQRLTLIMGLLLLTLLAGALVWRFALPNKTTAGPSMPKAQPAPAAALPSEPNSTAPAAEAVNTAASSPSAQESGAPELPSAVEVADPKIADSAAARLRQVVTEPPPSPVTVDLVATDPPSPRGAEAAALQSQQPRPESIIAPGTTTTSALPADPEPGQRLPGLSQLPQLQQQIGPLEMSMLVFNADPTRRFALINGQRMRQGDELAGGVRLLEIGRNECVFEANGQKFVLRSQ